MSSNPAKRFTPRFKFQIVLESLKGEKAVGQLARSFGTHPISIHRWEKEFMEKGPEIFSQDTTIHEYEKKIADTGWEKVYVIIKTHLDVLTVFHITMCLRKPTKSMGASPASNAHGG